MATTSTREDRRRAVDLAPGKYLFVCNIDGHFKHGMYEVVFVTP